MLEAPQGSQLLFGEYPGELFAALPEITEDVRNLELAQGVQRSSALDVLYDTNPYRVAFGIAEVGRELDVSLRWRVAPRMCAVMSLHRVVIEGRAGDGGPKWLPMYIGRLGAAGVVMLESDGVLRGHQATEEESSAVDDLFGALAHWAHLAVSSAPRQ